MPQMANITVKKADGTTDVVYTALTPAGGDNSPARWSANALALRWHSVPFSTSGPVTTEIVMLVS